MSSQGPEQIVRNVPSPEEKSLRDRILYEVGFAERLLQRVYDKVLGEDPKYRHSLADFGLLGPNPYRYSEMITTDASLTLEKSAWMWMLNFAKYLPEELLSMILEVAREIETKS